jgi:uncharacterized membrane protein
MRMRRAILSTLAYVAVAYFSTYLINDAILGQTSQHKMCVLIFSINFIWKISHSKKNRARYFLKIAQAFMSNNSHSYILIKIEILLYNLEN